MAIKLSNVEITELLVTKICHDMSGPVSAIRNGVELLKDDNIEIQEGSVELVESSAQDSISKLIFFRQAYGSLGKSVEINFTALQEMTKNFFKNKKITVSWEINANELQKKPSNSGNTIKIILNSILLISNSLIYGGNIMVRISNKNGEYSMVIKGEGKSVKIEDQVRSILVGDNDNYEIDVKNIQPYFLTLLADRADSKIKLDYGETYMELSA